MRRAGKIVAGALDLVGRSVRPKLRTIELDRVIENFILKNGCRPAFKGYQGFPASICSSINEEVVHGIPGKRSLKPGDIISIDIGLELDGYYADAAATFPVGEISGEAVDLIEITKKALNKGIGMATAGNNLSDISHIIQATAESAGYSVVRDYVGHGIGREMHEEPQVPNFGLPGRGPELKEGMVLALEPMVNAGDYEVKVLADDWTVVTADGSLSAHFEHTVAITTDGPEILTGE